MTKKLDLIGEKFNKLTVVREASKEERKTRTEKDIVYWICSCDCGSLIEVIVSDLNLVYGSVKSCGCLGRQNFKDLTGKEFGRWLVIERTEKPINRSGKSSFWLCECQCENKTRRVVSSASLRSGKSKSCGCALKEKNRKRNFKGEGESALTRTINVYKKRAKDFDYEFSLSRDDFKEIIKKDCFYCGEKSDRRCKSESNSGDFIYTGIDRIDSDKGYILNNCVPCCIQCNKAKSNYSKENFYQWIIKIYDHLKNKNEI